MKGKKRPTLPWQANALSRFVASTVQKDFVIVAGTGCGKTHAGTICAAHEHSSSKEKTLILVVVPYRSIKGGWETSFIEQGFDVASKKSELAEDTDVIITTYAGAPGVLDYFTKNMYKKLIIVFDEFHHMEENNCWAEPFIQGMNEDDYVKRIFLSGTPWHETGALSETMVKYENDLVVHDVLYTYGEDVNSTIAEGRNTVAVKFHRFQARWEDEGIDGVSGKTVVRTLDTETMYRSDPMTPFVDFSTVSELVKLDGVMACIEGGLRQLGTTRKIVPTAGGIIFVKDKRAGKAVKTLLESDYDEDSLLVTSDDPKAHAMIKEFRKSKEAKWVIAIDMIAEGTDVPRLKVAIDLTNKTTLMHIMQRWGRILRLMRHKDHKPAKNTEAHVFFIAHPQLVYVAEEIEKDVRKFKREPTEGGEPPGESTFISGTITETAAPIDDMFKGRTIDQQISSLADWIISTGYMDLVNDGYGLSEALLLAKHMLQTDTVPDCYEEPATYVAPETTTQDTRSKDEIVISYTKLKDQIGARRFNENYEECGKFLKSKWGGPWSRENKTRDELLQYESFLRGIARGEYGH